MQFKQMLVTAVWVLFLLKLKWPKSKNQSMMLLSAYLLILRLLTLLGRIYSISQFVVC